MNSFIGISEAQTTNLAVVAPGIAEALLATAIGLVAAIPAVVIYNVFARASGGYRLRLTEAAAGVQRLVSRDLDRRARDRSAHTCGVGVTHDEPQPRERLQDARGLAAAARREPLHGDRLADRRLGDDQAVDVEIVVVLGIGDGRSQHLARIDRHRLLREGEDVHRVAGLLAADQARDQVQLLRRTADLRADGERFIVGDATGSLFLAHQRLPFLSAA